MLPSMNYVFIPFLLEALGSVENHTEWSSGPEYVFDLTKTTVVHVRVFIMEIGSARVTCRPKELSNQFQKVLLCSASKIAVLSITKTDKRHENLFKIPDQSFEIKFSAEGVQYVRPNKKEEKLDYNDFIIQDVIEQFDNSFALSVEAKSGMKNYRNKKDRLHFIHNSKRNSEDTGDSLCNSTMKITYKPLNIFRNKNHIRNHKIYDNYKNIQNQMHKTYLRLLSKSNTNSNETFSVERFTMACPYQPQNIFFANTTWKISKTDHYSKIEIYDTKPKFKSYIGLRGNVFFPDSTTTYDFKKDVRFRLLHIKPAQSSLMRGKENIH